MDWKRALSLKSILLLAANSILVVTNAEFKDKRMNYLGLRVRVVLQYVRFNSEYLHWINAYIEPSTWSFHPHDLGG